MILEAIRAAFDEIATRSVDLPWFGPNGERWRVEIYSHDRPEYQKALGALEINPLGAKERNPQDESFMATLVRQQMAEQSPNGKADEEPERKARECKEIRAFDFPRLYPGVGYCRAEIDKARPAVLRHLVAKGFEVAPDGTERELSAKELNASFASDAALPDAMQVARDGEETTERLVFAGEKQGVALAAAVLRETVQVHLFQERIVPLSKGSEPDEEPRDTTGEKQGPPLQSPQDSQPASGAVAS